MKVTDLQVTKTKISSVIHDKYAFRLGANLLCGVALISMAGVVQAQAATDKDGDGVPDNVELAEKTDPDNALNFIDSDGDGVPDYVDADSDGDHVVDRNEYGGNPYRDTDNDGIPAYLDDHDGDASIGNDSGKISFLFDPDGNNTAAFQDSSHDHRVDSDGDKVPDSTEMAEGTNPSDPTSFLDTDGDGIADIVDPDSDGDGIWNPLESGALPYYDRDCDGVPAYIDDDDFTWEVGNNNGAVQSLFDPDQDGVASFQDASEVAEDGDSDGDGVPDAIEAVENTDPQNAAIFLDSDGDGIANYLDDDDDNDTILDVIEGTGDIDGDSIPNHLDLDSDGDGVSDQDEGIADADGDFIPNFVDPSTTGVMMISADQDNDGLSDAIEGNEDTDNDGIANLLDLDSDGDSIPDSIENNSDLDGDTLPNFLDTDSDGDGLLDIIEGTADPDGDLRGNFIDLDSDADSTPDSIELNGDADGDGIPNYLDLDSDGDSIADSIETSEDTDGDGIPNYLDNDSDNDGVEDIIELVVDNDGDNVFAFLDPDDEDPAITVPVVNSNVVGVGLGGGCSVFDKTDTKDPLLLFAALTALAGLLRRRTRQ